MKKTRIFFFGDHPLMILGIGTLIDKEPDFSLSGSSSNFETLPEEVKNENPDALVLDIALYSQTSLDLIRTLRDRNPKLAIIILSVHRQAEYMQKALTSGANAYVLKTDDPRNLLTAIRSALAGEIFKSARIETKNKHQIFVSDSPINRLSRAEFEILQDIGKGMTDREIAANRSLPTRQIEETTTRIREKLDLRDPVELLQFAVHWVHHEGGFH